MKKKLFLYLLFMSWNSCIAQIRNFNDVVLHNVLWSRSHPYMVFRIQSPNYVGWVTIVVNELYDCLNQQKNMAIDSFITHVSNQLYEEGHLNITDTNLLKLGFQPVFKHDSVRKYAMLGKEAFLYHYFRGTKRLQMILSHQEKSAMIAKLFEWNIACNEGHDSSGLYIVRAEMLWLPIVQRHPKVVRELMQTFENIFCAYLAPDDKIYPCKTD